MYNSLDTSAWVSVCLGASEFPTVSSGFGWVLGSEAGIENTLCFQSDSCVRHMVGFPFSVPLFGKAERKRNRQRNLERKRKLLAAANWKAKRKMKCALLPTWALQSSRELQRRIAELLRGGLCGIPEIIQVILRSQVYLELNAPPIKLPQPQSNSGEVIL